MQVIIEEWIGRVSVVLACPEVFTDGLAEAVVELDERRAKGQQRVLDCRKPFGRHLVSTITVSDGSLIATFDGLPASASRVL